jgi:PAS domain S-box-containing protein
MTKYEHIFENAPISIWEEDWSEVKHLLDELKDSVPPEEFMNYLNVHLGFVKRLAHAIKIIKVNKKTVELYEAKDEDELINSSIVETFLPQSLITFKEEMVALYRGDKEFETEIELQTLKGTPLYAIIQVGFPQKENDFKNVIVIMIDITPSKRNHQKYLETKAKFHRSFYQGIVGMAITDVNGNILEVNDSFCDFTGYTADELSRMNISRLQEGRNSNEIDDMFNLLKNNIDSIKGERLLFRKDGKSIWAYIGLNLLRDDDGNPLYFVGQVVDIDQEKKSAIIQENNVQKYKQLMDSTNAVYLILDEEGEIKEFSEKFIDFFGDNCIESDLSDKSLRTLVSTESMPTFDDAWKRINEGQTVNSVEIALTRRNSFKWVSMNASMLQNGGKKVFVLLTDISARKRKEFERLIAKEKRRDKLRNNIQDIRNTIVRIGSR